jgi:hypothetical protein
MKRYSTLILGAALLTFAGSQAGAACRDEIASLSPGTTTGSAPGTMANTEQGRISKDGTHAPLATGSTSSTGSGSTATGTTGQTQAQGGVSKDGSTMPLANEPGGGNRQVATSQQDVQSQQQGGQTAAAAGRTASTQSSGYNSPERMAALDRARTMLQQGNEAGCMQAVQDAKRLGQ